MLEETCNTSTRSAHALLKLILEEREEEVEKSEEEANMEINSKHGNKTEEDDKPGPRAGGRA